MIEESRTISRYQVFYSFRPWSASSFAVGRSDRCSLGCSWRGTLASTAEIQIYLETNLSRCFSQPMLHPNHDARHMLKCCQRREITHPDLLACPPKRRYRLSRLFFPPPRCPVRKQTFASGRVLNFLTLKIVSAMEFCGSVTVTYRRRIFIE